LSVVVIVHIQRVVCAVELTQASIKTETTVYCINYSCSFITQ